MNQRITGRILEYVAVFEQEHDGGFSVVIPALPGCISEGDTFEEAQENIQEAAELYLSVMKERRNLIPKQSRFVVAAVGVKV